VLKVGGTILGCRHNPEDLERRSKAESAGLVFTMESGTAVDPKSALRPISTATKALGMSGVGLHTLRHLFATHVLAAGVPPHTVSELLGHSPVAAGDGHGHVADQGARLAVQRLSAAMGW
jgi:site-specific recombinase XerD